MPSGSEPVSALTLVMSSAVVSALVNVGWGAFSRWLERNKEAREKAQKVGHVYLALALQLEAFARQCNERLYDIRVALERYRSEEDGSGFNTLSKAEFEFEPEPDWAALPVSFVANVKGLPTRFRQCDMWINEQFQHWADLDEAFELEMEKLAFYALKACDLSSKIRTQIRAESDETDGIVGHFQTILDRRHNSYLNRPGQRTFIPELHAQFENERSESSGLSRAKLLGKLMKKLRAP